MARSLTTSLKLLAGVCTIVLAGGAIAGCALQGRTVEQAKTLAPAAPAGLEPMTEKGFTGPLKRDDERIALIGVEGLKNAYSWSFVNPESSEQGVVMVQAVAAVTEKQLEVDRGKLKELRAESKQGLAEVVDGKPEISGLTLDVGASSNAGFTMAVKDEQGSMRFVYWFGTINNVTLFIGASAVYEAGVEPMDLEATVEKMARSMVKKAS